MPKYFEVPYKHTNCDESLVEGFTLSEVERFTLSEVEVLIG